MSEVTPIKDLLQMLLKTKKLVRMYLENNPMYIKAINDMYEKFREVFQDTGNDIVLNIREYEILYDDKQAYYNPPSDKPLSLLIDRTSTQVHLLLLKF